MITLLDAYIKANQYICQGLIIDSCAEYKDYYAFQIRNRKENYVLPGLIGVRKSTDKLCHIIFLTSNFCYASWDYETGKPISDDIGELIKKYSEKELKALA